MSYPPSIPSAEGRPLVALQHLDELWFQVGGTLCNLSCHHCFISCHPGNKSFGFLDLATVSRFLDESRELGVREYYFTGGEPFLNRELPEILAKTLEVGPATVLTNGTVLPPRVLDVLRELSQTRRYSLEIRISIDGYDATTNDPIRGAGTFDAAMAGLARLVAAGMLPIVTIAQTWPEHETADILRRFESTLRAAGYERPRFKILPTLHIGEEADRSRPYDETERVTADMLDGYDIGALLCSRGRIVTDRGIAVCPILIETPEAILGPTLSSAGGAFEVRHGACYTCYRYGAICSNAGARGEG
jgi:sulfatase maturation enzyme AslB (radical SAM superfamily)